MNKKNLRRKIILVSVLAGIFLFTGCTRAVDADGHTLPEKIIYLSTSWGSIWQNEGLLTFIFVYPLAQCINWLSKYMNVAWAITLTTVLLHIILMPLSVKSTTATQKMQMLQPEMTKIQNKYANRTDEYAQAQMGQEMQNLYKKYNINPITSMILPFVQLPIIISMYYAVQRANAVVTGTIAGVDIQTTPQQALAMGGKGWALVFIFVLMGVAQFISSKISQWMADKANKETRRVKSYAKQPENPQAKSGKIMIYVMLIMILWLGWKWPTAMSLYWLISSVINILKTVYIQRRFVNKDAKANG